MKTIRRILKLRRQRGSALLVSLMVMVGLSLLGLGFVAISETESSISVNQRNSTQTLQVAEAGARAVVEWFNNPSWARTVGMMPVNSNAIKHERRADVVDSFGATSTYIGYYKPRVDDGDPATADQLLCDLPYKSASEHRFFGVDEKSADIYIDRSNAADFLTTFNNLLFNTTDEGGRVTEIAIYAPPILNTVAGHPVTEYPVGSKRYFWNGGTRYGVATIKVTAEKTQPANCRFGVDSPCSLLAKRAVKLVVSEFPFPGPEGPLQSQSGITTNGAFEVHWGKIVSLGALALKREFTSVPWFDAYKQIPWEYGYDDVTWPPTAAADKRHFLYELIGKSWEDPWFQARARGDITTDGGLTIDIPAQYDDVNDREATGTWAAGNAGWSNQMQNQDRDLYPTRKNVLFPRIDYKFWKQIATSSTGQSGIYYLQYDAATEKFRDRAGNLRTFGEWTNTLASGREGFFFFDTRDGTNPQRSDGTTITEKLTPSIDLNSSDGNPFHMKGFIYLNALTFGSQGLNGKAGFFNAPGEPFRDIGYHQVDEDGSTTYGLGNYIQNPDTTPHMVNYTNYQWDFQDLPLAAQTGGVVTSGGVKNGKFDYVVAVRASQPVDGTDSTALANEYYIKPYFDGCNVGTNCSEPHEPYLNVIYPAEFAKQNSTSVNTYTVRWQAPGSQTRQPKVFQADGTTRFDCTTGTPTPDQCTSNGYDDLGPLLRLGHQASDGPILDGVFYNEGGYDSTGNANYYGSVVVRGVASRAGNIDVWFDYRLTKTDKWQERFKNLARVLITSHETDQ